MEERDFFLSVSWPLVLLLVSQNVEGIRQLVCLRLLSYGRRPLLQDARPLPDGQPYPRPMLDRPGKDLPRLVEVAAGVEHALDPGAVLGPLVDLVVVAVVRKQRLVHSCRRIRFADTGRAGLPAIKATTEMGDDHA